MAAPRPELEEDTLFIACTRPAMIAGVTMEAMGINVMATTIFYLAAGSVAYALNLGTQVPPSGTTVVCHAVGGRWCFRYDG